MKTILSFGAHPDDIEFGCGGTEVLLNQKGYRIIHVIITSGEEGGMDLPKHQLACQREQEAINAANKIGVDKVIFLRQSDSFTGYSKELKIQVIQIIRNYRPYIVFTHASGDEFPDHQVVYRLTKASVTAAAGPWFSDAKGKPYTVPYLLGYEVWHPIHTFQMAVSIESVLTKKLQALSCHQSQTDTVDYLSAAKGLAAYRGAMSMKSAYAEVFEIMQAYCLDEILE